MNVLLMAPLIKPIENVQALKDAVKQQGNMMASFNKMLGCDRPDKFKIAYDQRQIDIADGDTDLPLLKQI